jgi:LysR family transcriptional activator of glutamate synthase operon
VSIADLEKEPMVALKVGYGLRHVTDRLCREAGFVPRIEIEVTELSTLRGLVATGLGVAVVPASRSGHASESAILEIPFSDPTAFRPYGAVTRRGGPGGQVARRFLRFVARSSMRPVQPCRLQYDGRAEGSAA